MSLIILVPITLSSFIGFFAIILDKYKPETKKEWKIFIVIHYACALLLGAPGILIGMLSFRHKIKNYCYWYVVVIGLAIDLFLLLDTSHEIIIGDNLIPINSNYSDNYFDSSEELIFEKAVEASIVVSVAEDGSTPNVTDKPLEPEITNETLALPSKRTGSELEVEEPTKDVFSVLGLTSIRQWFKRWFNKFFG